MKILVTGFSGFVSRHFLDYLEANRVDAEVLGVARRPPAFFPTSYRNIAWQFQRLDLLYRDGVEETIRRFRPTHILHLAAYSSVGFSWDHPAESFANNTNIFLNVLEQVRKIGIRCRILSVGSSEEYGDVSPGALPLREDATLKPVSPYGVARVAQEMLSNVFVRGYGLDILMTRSFNHIGPYQRDAFLVPSLARQLTAIRHRGAIPRLMIGDRTITRDFVDVRDVVRAYFDLLVRGATGEVYNVCSGRGVRIEELITLMQQELGTDAVVETDPQLVRPNDNRAIIGSNDKIREAICWSPSIALRDSLAAVLAWARDEPLER